MNRTAAPLVVVVVGLLLAACGSAVVSETGAGAARSSLGSAPSSPPAAPPTPVCADDPSGADLVHASTGPDGAAPRRMAGQDDELDVADRVDREFTGADGLVGVWIDSTEQLVGVIWFGPLPEGLQRIEDATADVDLVVYPSDISRADLDAASDRLVEAYLEPGDDGAASEVDAVSVAICNDGSGVQLTVAEDSVPGGVVPTALVTGAQTVASPVPVLVVAGSRLMLAGAG